MWLGASGRTAAPFFKETGPAEDMAVRPVRLTHGPDRANSHPRSKSPQALSRITLAMIQHRPVIPAVHIQISTDDWSSRLPRTISNSTSPMAQTHPMKILAGMFLSHLGCINGTSSGLGRFYPFEINQEWTVCQFENPLFIPLKMPFRRFETWLEGVSGAKAVFFGFRCGASRKTPAAATATTMMISAMFFMFQPLPLWAQGLFDGPASDFHHHETA